MPCSTSLRVGGLTEASPASRRWASQPPRSSPSVPIVAMAAALRPQRPIGELGGLVGDEQPGRGPCAAPTSPGRRWPRQPGSGRSRRARSSAPDRHRPRCAGTQRRISHTATRGWTTESGEHRICAVVPSVRARTVVVRAAIRTASMDQLLRSRALASQTSATPAAGHTTPTLFGLHDDDAAEERGEHVEQAPDDRARHRWHSVATRSPVPTRISIVDRGRMCSKIERPETMEP